MQVTAKFRCVVRFIQVFPRDVRRFHDLNGKFKLLAILEDATARVHASLYADEGVNILITVMFRVIPSMDCIMYLSAIYDRRSFSGVTQLMKRLWSRSWIHCWEGMRWTKLQKILHGCNVACSLFTETKMINGEAEDSVYLIHGSTH